MTDTTADMTFARSSTPIQPEAAAHYGTTAKPAQAPPAFPIYSYRNPPIGRPARVYYIRDPRQADWIVPTLRSPIGFDTEWKPVFTKNTPANKTALIQLADADTIVLIQIRAMRYIPESVKQLLQDPNIIKVGRGIRGDALKLHSERRLQFQALLELGDFAKMVDHLRWEQKTKQNMPGLSTLCETYLQRSMIKGRITRSNWEMVPMTQAMQEYAANDAHSSVMIFHRLAQLHQEMEAPPSMSSFLFRVDGAIAQQDRQDAEERKKAKAQAALERKIEREKKQQELEAEQKKVDDRLEAIGDENDVEQVEVILEERVEISSISSLVELA